MVDIKYFATLNEFINLGTALSGARTKADITWLLMKEHTIT